MGQILEKAKKYKKPIILTTLTVFAAAGFTYITIRIIKNKKQPYSISQEQILFPDEQFLEDQGSSQYSRSTKLDQVASQIKVSFLQGSDYLEPSTIVQILEHLADLAGYDYIRMTIKNREDRRRAKRYNRIDQYAQLIMENNEEIENLIEKAQKDLLIKLDINLEIYEESLLILMERGYFQQLYMLQASLKQKIKEKIPSKKNLSQQQVRDIIRYNIELLKSPPAILSQVLSKLQKSEEMNTLIPITINSIVSDLIFERYNVEEEDQIRNLKKQGFHLNNLHYIEYIIDSEIQQSLCDLEQIMMEFMNSYGFGGIDQLPESLEEFG